MHSCPPANPIAWSLVLQSKVSRGDPADGVLMLNLKQAADGILIVYVSDGFRK